MKSQSWESWKGMGEEVDAMHYVQVAENGGHMAVAVSVETPQSSTPAAEPAYTFDEPASAMWQRSMEMRD
ncbi:MAG TPA: hypothetical protein VFL85_05010 [Candidatus Saccharimonadales bacterium]|nr:hypothetical protein [Candidatus Saccharimonadales bacterium]